MDYKNFISKLEEIVGADHVMAGPDSARARCPGHEGQSDTSLSITQLAGGRVRVHCFAGCTVEIIAKAMGMNPADLGDQPAGCTLEQFSEKLGIPRDFLQKRGLSDGFYKLGDVKTAATLIPYYNEFTEHLTTRSRIALEGPNKFRFPKGAKARGLLYGAEYIPEFDTSHAVLVEGESDTLTGAYNGFQFVGAPGAGMIDPVSLAARLEKFEKVFVVIEQDAGGDTVLKKLEGTSPEFQKKIRLLDLHPHKDTSEMYVSDPEQFVQRFKEAMSAAPSLSEYGSRQEADARAAAYLRALELISCDNIPDKFADAVAEIGVVGERRNIKIFCLVAVSSNLEKPVSVVLMSESSTGKSHQVRSCVKLVPPAAVFKMDGMSPKALQHLHEPLKNRLFYIAESPAEADPNVEQTIRILQSENCFRYQYVAKDPETGELRTVENVIEGPTNVITTTTRAAIHNENATRCLLLKTDDSPEQTRAIIDKRFELHEHPPTVDEEKWHAFFEWIAGSTNKKVSIPFYKMIAANIPPVAVRLRRDADVIISLICAHALLHQGSREIDAQGRIVATIADYKAIYELIADRLVAQSADGVDADAVKFFNTLEEAAVTEDDRLYVTAPQMMAVTERSKNFVYRKLAELTTAGYLSREKRKQPHRYYVNNERPGKPIEILPAPSVVAAETPDPEPAAVEEVQPVRRDPGDWEFVAGPVPKDGTVFN